MIAAGGSFVAVQLIIADAGAHVHRDDVSLFQLVAAGHAVDDLIIHRDTAGALEAVQVIEGGVATVLFDELLHLVVDLPGGDAGLDQRPGIGAGHGGQPPCFPHQINLMRREGHAVASDHASTSMMTALVASMVGWFWMLFSTPRWA